MTWSKRSNAACASKASGSSKNAAAVPGIIACRIARRSNAVALISVAEALDHVLAHAAPLPVEEAPLAEADGRVLAYDLKALRTQPPADVSAMDGYAVRSGDAATAPVRLKVIGEVAAGRPFTAAGSHGSSVDHGEAARIFTGGVVPAGADAVVVQELTKRDGD